MMIGVSLFVFLVLLLWGLPLLAVICAWVWFIRRMNGIHSELVAMTDLSRRAVFELRQFNGKPAPKAQGVR